jgi:hypothetical protein
LVPLFMGRRREARRDRAWTRDSRRASRALTDRHHLTPNVSGKYEAFVLHPPEHVAVDPPWAGNVGVIVGPHT